MTDAGTDGDFVGVDVGSASAVLAAVGQLTIASEQASLVRLGLSSGLLAYCTKSVIATDLAAAVNAPQTAVAAVCDALIALGALQREGNEVRLSPAWAPLAQDGLDVMLERNLDGAATRQCLIEEALSEPTTYWELGAVQRRALAESVTLPSMTGFGRFLAYRVVAGIPELDQMMRSGARYLELGCGVAGGLLGYAHHYRDLHAVGVDIAPDLLEVARARADELGIGGRVRFVECDARAYTDDKPFDLVFWSQFFFPRDTRQATLENAFARLRPGGLLICPVLGGDGESPETGSQAAQQASLDAIICGRSDIPVLSCDDLAKEVTAAGFADAQEHRGDVATVVIARRAAS